MASQLNANESQALPPSGTADPMEAYYKAIIGTNNQDYYLDKFSRFDRKGKAGISWHWPAFFVTFGWLLYRRMWWQAIVYFLLINVLLQFMWGIESGTGSWEQFIFALSCVAIYLIPPLFANAMYYKKCRNKIAKSIKLSHAPETRLAWLSTREGTGWVLGLCSLPLYLAVLSFLLMVVMNPSVPRRHEGQTRARVSEALRHLEAAKAPITEYYEQKGQFPATLQQVGVESRSTRVVKEITFNGETHVLAVTLAKEPLEGMRLLLVPSIDSDNKIVWTCGSDEIPEKYLPMTCRTKQ